ncbi:SRPBCC family protein [Spirochaeta africana]|uniref:Activator of Hsp90 ATPase homolog 1-like protein n=1 Tax=Spirochaeta africana (strain ATCC 700263 / DSM 8902 / Z-7692) TaxID=889378 RepID=H9UG49_SPIAZ|nr:SRPBCC domain-containing protein [Spirochaeta africana]AFG36492.1 hypothetical protein Spiaf_0387 [Spirochaeta africana DSM 8902]
MSVHIDNEGRRVVEAMVDVPGTPDEVWRAIATSRGISSWFVPTSLDEHTGGHTTSRFGPEMDAESRITVWNPPRNYTAESGEGLAKVVTEWIVEPRNGRICMVRVVHRWFADTDDQDATYEGHVYGWEVSYFRLLDLYLQHFSGMACTAVQLTAFSDFPGPKTWRTLKQSLKIDTRNGRIHSASTAPELSGKVIPVNIEDPELLRIRKTAPIIAAAREGMDGEEPELILQLDRPTPGLAHMMILPMEAQTLVSVRFHFFGSQSGSIAATAELDWKAWLSGHFAPEVSAQKIN